MRFVNRLSHKLLFSVLAGGSSLALGGHAAFAREAAPRAGVKQTAPQAGTTTIKGQVAVTSFPRPPSQIRVTSAGMPVAQAALGADGSFKFDVPTGRDFQVELAAGGTSYQLIFPRGKAVETSFEVRGAREPFDLGLVQYIESAHATGIMVAHANPTKATEKPNCAFGKICVDDAEAGEDVCGPLAPGAQASPARSPAASTAPAGPAAVAEHNLPAALGCEP